MLIATLERQMPALPGLGLRRCAKSWVIWQGEHGPVWLQTHGLAFLG